MSAPYRGPRRAAAIQSQRLTTAIINTRRGVRPPLPSPPPPRPVPPPPPALPNCVYCNAAVNPRDEFERCRHCRRWAHHACVNGSAGHYDRQCRGLCAHQPDHPTTGLNGQPFVQNVNCPGCGRRFRHRPLEARARWLRIFGTRSWQAYIRRRRAQMNRFPNRMNPTIGPNNPFFDAVYQPEDEWFITERHHNLVHLSNRFFVTHFNSLIFGGTYNNHTNGPFRLHPQSYHFFLNNILPRPRLPEFRNFWFVIHPTRAHLADDDVNQQYMFSELNYIMHSDRQAWKKFCRIFDNVGLNLATL